MCNRSSHMSGAKNPMSSFVLRETTGKEVLIQTKRLKNKRSLDCFSMPKFLLKTVNPILCEILKILFNRMIVECGCPDCLKVAKAVPVKKSGEKSDPGNYPPISLVPILPDF